MAKTFLQPIDLSGLELRNFVVQNLASAPGSPVEGQAYYDTVAHTLYVRTNSAWVDALAALGAIAASAVTVDSTTLVGTGVNAQAVFEELDDAIAAVVAAEAAHEADTTAAHAASAISADSTTLVGTGTTVQAVFEELDNQVATNLANIVTLLARSLSDFAAPTGDLSINSHKLTGVSTPTADTDAANKGYVDAAAAGIDWKRSVRAATTAAGTLASSFENGDTIDGVALATGDRILIKDQASGAANGIYVVAASGAPTRATDADTAAEVTSGMAVFVEEGTVNADSGWVLTNNGAIVVDTTALVFGRFSGLSDVQAGAGLTKTGNTLDVGAGAGITVAADTVLIDTAVVVRKYATDLTGSSTSYTVTHNLGTLDVTVGVFANSGGVEVEVDVTHATTNTVTIGFAVAPSSNAYRTVVHG